MVSSQDYGNENLRLLLACPEQRRTKNNVQEEFEADLKAKKKHLAKHMWIIWDRYVGRILETRFEVTESRLNFTWFGMEMEINPHDVEVVALFSFGEDIHDNIGTNKCNKFCRSGGDLILRRRRRPYLNRPGRQRNQQKQLEQQGQGRKWSICAEPAAGEAGRERSR